MSEATSDYPLPRPAAPPRRARAVPRPRRADRQAPPEDPRLAAALSFHDPVFPLDPPLEDVRIPVKEPHAAATAYSRAALRRWFPDAKVGDDLHMLFSEPGRTGRSRLSPDVFVALDVPRRTPGDYDADVLGPPDFILEVLSRSTWRHDLGRKLRCYQSIGVRECMFFDVAGENRSRTGKELWGCALTPQREEPLEVVALPNGERGVRSEVLGLVAYVSERTPLAVPRGTWELTMRWHDPATGEDIPDYDEVYDRAEAAEREVQTVQARADAEQTRADAEQARADAEQARADAEQARAQAAQRRIAELEEQLRQRDGP